MDNALWRFYEIPCMSSKSFVLFYAWFGEEREKREIGMRKMEK
jgi:hypothetical protein